MPALGAVCAILPNTAAAPAALRSSSACGEGAARECAAQLALLQLRAENYALHAVKTWGTMGAPGNDHMFAWRIKATCRHFARGMR